MIQIKIWWRDVNTTNPLFLAIFLLQKISNPFILFCPSFIRNSRKCSFFKSWSYTYSPFLFSRGTDSKLDSFGVFWKERESGKTAFWIQSCHCIFLMLKSEARLNNKLLLRQPEAVSDLARPVPITTAKLRSKLRPAVFLLLLISYSKIIFRRLLQKHAFLVTK